MFSGGGASSDPLVVMKIEGNKIDSKVSSSPCYIQIPPSLITIISSSFGMIDRDHVLSDQDAQSGVE